MRLSWTIGILSCLTRFEQDSWIPIEDLIVRLTEGAMQGYSKHSVSKGGVRQSTEWLVQWMDAFTSFL
jgi:hypothetical protein